MKYIKSWESIINEAVGIPEDILNASDILFNKIKNYIVAFFDPKQKTYKIDWKPEPVIKYSDRTITRVLITVNISKSSDDEFRYAMGVNRENKSINPKEKIGKDVVSFKSSYDLEISLSLNIPDAKFNFIDLEDIIEQNKNDIKSTIAHEIKHDYDFSKKERIPLNKFSEYRAFLNMHNLMFGPVKSVFYKLYYLSNFENLVRPTEFLSKLKSKEISKSQFLDYFKKEYDILFKAKDFKIADLIDELKNDMSSIDKLLGKFIDVKSMTSEEKIMEFLSKTYILYVKEAEKLYKRKLLNLGPNNLFQPDEYVKNIELEGLQKKSYDDFMKDLNKYINDPIQFYNNVENTINSSAEKMIKKLSKLYSLLPD